MKKEPTEPVYYISVVARLLNTHPQTLRMYERFGLVEPSRRGHQRLFSEDDVERIRRIQHLTQDLGINLAGVEVVFKLLDEMERMRSDLDKQLEQMRAETNRALAGLVTEETDNGAEAKTRQLPPRRKAVRIPVREGKQASIETGDEHA